MGQIGVPVLLVRLEEQDEVETETMNSQPGHVYLEINLRGAHRVNTWQSTELSYRRGGIGLRPGS